MKKEITTGNFKILLILLLTTYTFTVILNTGCVKFGELFFVIFLIVLISYCIGVFYPAKDLKKED